MITARVNKDGSEAMYKSRGGTIFILCIIAGLVGRHFEYIDMEIKSIVILAAIIAVLWTVLTFLFFLLRTHRPEKSNANREKRREREYDYSAETDQLQDTPAEPRPVDALYGALSTKNPLYVSMLDVPENIENINSKDYKLLQYELPDSRKYLVLFQSISGFSDFREALQGADGNRFTLVKFPIEDIASMVFVNGYSGIYFNDANKLIDAASIEELCRKQNIMNKVVRTAG